MQNWPKHVLRSALVPQEPFGSPFLQELQKMLATLAYSEPHTCQWVCLRR